MPRFVPYPSDLFAPGRRHVFVFAHQDDEMPYAGLLQRVVGDVRAIWVTNGDGLAHEDGIAPPEYAERRRRESEAAVGLLGLAPSALTFLGHSEYANYAAFARMMKDGTAGAAAVWPMFLKQAGEVEDALRAAAPDVVWTLAYQGGHPEHDLTHLFVRRAVRRLAEERVGPLPLYELPEYELLYTVPLRFRPWLPGEAHEILLSDGEVRRKLAMGPVYVTQRRIVKQFQTLLGILDRVAAPLAEGDPIARWLSRETFRLVPPELDPRRSPQPLDVLTYTQDDYDGVPIRWKGSIRHLARLLEES